MDDTVQSRPPKGAVFHESHCKTIEELGLANRKIEEGVSEVQRKYFSLTVHNHDGYVCQIDLKCFMRMDPDTLYKILGNPDNSAVFRDIHSCTYRQVLETDGKGYNLLEVEQVAEIKMLFWKGYFATLLLVEEEQKELPYKMTFRLKRSGLMRRFAGQWVVDKGPDGQGSCATLKQAIMPAGCPPWMTRLPFVGRLLRGSGVRAIVRLVEDLKSMDDELAEGKSLEEVFEGRKEAILAAKGPAPRPGADLHPLKSHTLDVGDVDDDDEDDDDDKHQIGSGEEQGEGIEPQLYTAADESEEVPQVPTKKAEGTHTKGDGAAAQGDQLEVDKPQLQAEADESETLSVLTQEAPTTHMEGEGAAVQGDKQGQAPEVQPETIADVSEARSEPTQETQETQAEGE